MVQEVRGFATEPHGGSEVLLGLLRLSQTAHASLNAPYQKKGCDERKDAFDAI
jgi:hypothetical protein